MTPPTGFESAAVIGTGMMGPGIALTLALGGVPSTILSRSSESAARGLETARGQAGVLSAAELISESECAAAVELLHASTDFETTVGRAAIVIESAPEDLAFKQELFARLDRLAQPDAVLASNTSGLSITAVASACARPERVLTTHFWNPPHLVPLVEIVLGEKSSPAVAAAVRDLLAACGKTPVIVRRDRPGQLGNRLQMALVREAAHIIAEGIAGAADIDAVIKNGLGLRMPAYGLLEHMDVAGLDLAVAVAEYVGPDLYHEAHAPQYFRELVRQGHLGAKTGMGFYDWSSKSAADVRAARDAFILEVLRYRRRPAAPAS